MRRVVVTGLGAVTPIGLNTDDFWDAIKKNTVGIDTITSFDSSEYKAHLAAEVKGFNAADCMDFKASRRMEKFSQYAVAAAFEALKDSGLNIENEDAYMAGVSVGSGIGSLSAMENSHKKLLEKGPSRINPLLVPMMITNMAAGNVSIQLGLKGKSINVVTACATAALYIKEIFVDGAGILKRLRPAPQGRAHRIRKRSNHVTIVLGSKTAVENIVKE